MKLNDEQIGHVAAQTGFDPIPDGELMELLAAHFGDHTFYLSDNGLYIWELQQGTEEPNQAATAVMLAIWSDDTKSSLAPITPNWTSLTVQLAPVN